MNQIGLSKLCDENWSAAFRASCVNIDYAFQTGICVGASDAKLYKEACEMMALASVAPSEDAAAQMMARRKAILSQAAQRCPDLRKFEMPLSGLLAYFTPMGTQFKAGSSTIVMEGAMDLARALQDRDAFLCFRLRNGPSWLEARVGSELHPALPLSA